MGKAARGGGTEAAHTALQPPPCPPHRNQSAFGPVSGLAGEAAWAASVQTPSRAVHSGGMSGLVLLTVAGAVPDWRPLDFQRYAAPASRFNRPAMPVGHPKVRAFYAIATRVAGMGRSCRRGTRPPSANVARVSASAPGKCRAGRLAAMLHPDHSPGALALTRATVLVCLWSRQQANREAAAITVAGMALVAISPRSPGKRQRTRAVQGAAARSNAAPRSFPGCACAYPGYCSCAPVVQTASKP